MVFSCSVRPRGGDATEVVGEPGTRIIYNRDVSFWSPNQQTLQAVSYTLNMYSRSLSNDMTNTNVEGPYCNCSIMGPNTLILIIEAPTLS